MTTCPGVMTALENEYNSSVALQKEISIQLDNENSFFECEDDQARNGEMEDLEDALKEARLAYDRYSSSYFEYPELTFVHTPFEKTENLELSCSTETIEISKVREIVKVHGKTPDAVERILSLCNEQLPEGAISIEEWVKKYPLEKWKALVAVENK